MNRLTQVFACLALCLAASPSYAILERFLGTEKFPFSVEIPNRSKLAESLEEDLAEQRKQSDEFELIDQAPRAVQFDRRILTQLLESRGYYAATIQLRPNDEDLVYLIDPGPRYTIAEIEMAFPEGVDAPPRDELPAREGRPLRAADVLTTLSLLQDHVQKNSCLFRVKLTYTAKLDHETAQAYLRFRLAPSATVKFARPQIVGLESVEPDYLRRYFTIKEGECFSRTQIEQTRLNLLQTNLIARADVTIAKPSDGEVVVSFELTERSHRTIQAGFGWQNEAKFGVSLGWEHRNLWGRGQILEVSSRFSEIEKVVRAELTFPHFGRTGQNLVFHTDVTKKSPNAYDTLGTEVGVTLERPLQKHWAGSVGAVLEFPRVEADGEQQDYGLLSLPITVQHNRTDNLLNPTRGWAITARTQPFVDLYDTQRQFYKTTFSGTAYKTATDWAGRPTLALRLATGTISGIRLTDVPAHHRYYVGGGGSVRGYEFQSLGAFTDEPEPKPGGGLSFSEAAVELRLRVAENWGLVLFADGGYAYAAERPSFGEGFRWGAGLGVRYFTSFAPIRFDLATPLDPRNHAEHGTTDSNVQVYISIGQAF